MIEVRPMWIEIRPIVPIVRVSFPISRSIAQRLQFSDQLLISETSPLRRGKLKRKSRRLKTNDGRIVAAQMLEEPRPKVRGLANVDPKSAEETIDAGGLGRALQNGFALKKNLL
jgi:hypothetical protein